MQYKTIFSDMYFGTTCQVLVTHVLRSNQKLFTCLHSVLHSTPCVKIQTLFWNFKNVPLTTSVGVLLEMFRYKLLFKEEGLEVQLWQSREFFNSKQNLDIDFQNIKFVRKNCLAVSKLNVSVSTLSPVPKFKRMHFISMAWECTTRTYHCCLQSQNL